MLELSHPRMAVFKGVQPMVPPERRSEPFVLKKHHTLAAFRLLGWVPCLSTREHWILFVYGFPKLSTTGRPCSHDGETKLRVSS